MRSKKRCNKKAQGLSMQVIVLLAIAVLVLIVVTLMFSDQIFKGKNEIDYISAPIEYQTACLKQKVLPYAECVEKCKVWIVEHPGEHLKNAVVDGADCYIK